MSPLPHKLLSRFCNSPNLLQATKKGSDFQSVNEVSDTGSKHKHRLNYSEGLPLLTLSPARKLFMHNTSLWETKFVLIVLKHSFVIHYGLTMDDGTWLLHNVGGVSIPL